MAVIAYGLLLFDTAGRYEAERADSTILCGTRGMVKLARDYEITSNPEDGSVLAEGDRLVTGADGSAGVDLFDGSQVLLAPSTRLEVHQLSDERIRLILFQGRLYLRLKPQGDRQFAILTKNSVVKVVGTDLGVQFDREAEQTAVRVFEGMVDLFDKNKLQEKVLVTPEAELLVDAAGVSPSGTPVFHEMTLPPLPSASGRSFAENLYEAFRTSPLELFEEEIEVLTGGDGDFGAAAAEAERIVPNEAALKKIRNDIKLIQFEMVSFSAIQGRMPKQVDELSSLTTDERRDPWGKPYQIEELDGERIRIFSLGEDGRQGTVDDVKF